MPVPNSKLDPTAATTAVVRVRPSIDRSRYTASSPGTVRAQQVPKPEFLQLAPRPFQRRIVGGKQVEPSHGCQNRRATHDLSRVFNRVDDARVAAATDDDQAVPGIDNHRCVLGDGVFDQASRGLDASGAAPIAFGVLARDRTGEPHGRQELGRAGMFDEDAAERLIRCLQGQQAIPLRPIVPGSPVEDAARDVSAGESTGVLPGQLLSEVHEARCVITMVVRDDEIGHIRQMDPELDGVTEHGFRALAGVDQQSPAIDFEQRRESPLADATTGVSREHRGQHSHFDGSGGFRRAVSRLAEREDSEGDDRVPNTAVPHRQTLQFRFNRPRSIAPGVDPRNLKSTSPQTPAGAQRAGAGGILFRCDRIVTQPRSGSPSRMSFIEPDWRH